MSRTQILEDAYWAGRKKKSKGEQKAWVITYLPICNKENMDDIQSENHFGKNKSLGVS